jgi:hypothetical protein
MFTIPWEKIDRPFYFAGHSDPNVTTALPLIEFLSPLTYVSIITGFYIKNTEGDPVFGFPATCKGINNMQVDLRINDTTIFLSLAGLTQGYPLSQWDSYEKHGQFIPVVPNAKVQFGIYLPGTGFQYMPGYYCELWGYFTKIPWTSYGDQT